MKLHFKKWLEEVGAGASGLEPPQERPELLIRPTHHGLGSTERPPTKATLHKMKKKMKAKSKKKK